MSIVRAGRARGGRDHWSFLFGSIAVHSFIVLVITGIFLMFFFEPSTAPTAYDGSYARMRGVRMSEAYASTLHLSFDVRGGLLMRQLHHWAALIFIASITLQLTRIFFTGAFRRPRTGNWLIWIALMVLGMAAGVTGSVLPDDMLSGGSLGLIQGVAQSIPVVGTYLTVAMFGGDIPGDKIIPRMYWVHVAVLPILMIGLLVLRFWLVRRFGHTRFRGGGAVWSAALRRRQALAFFFATAGVLAALSTLAQINPIWLYGPFEPGAISAGSVPGWYMGFLDGALRIMPNWEIDVFGGTLTLAVLIPALIVPGGFFTALAAYPVIERWATGDRRIHHVLDRPRDAATRTGLGAAGITFYGLLWAAAANDQIATMFHLSLESVTWFFRLAVIAGPPLAFSLTRRICLGLQRRDRHTKKHGFETGIVRQLPNGGFVEVTRPLPESTRPADAPPAKDAPAPKNRLQATAQRFYAVDLPEDFQEPDPAAHQADRELPAER